MLKYEIIPDIETPMLWVDLDAFESNVNRLASHLQAAGVNWRPHFKGLRVVELARKQIEAGAIGVSCSKVSEAEAAAAAGIHSILIVNEIVTAGKIARVVEMVRSGTEIIVCVDSLQNIDDLSQAAIDAGIRLPVLVDVDIGLRRCGVAPGQAAVSLSRRADQARGLVYKGLMGYEGHTEVITNPVEKQHAIEDSIGALVETANLCRAEGLPVEIISSGSSITYTTTAHIVGVTEIQAGGASFMDVVYDSLGVMGLEFSLFIRATIISRTQPTRAVVDAGGKWMGCVYFVPAPSEACMTWIPCPVAMPRPVGLGVHIEALHAEHALLRLEPDVNLGVGDQIDFIAGYADYTILHFDRLYAIRQGKIEAVWHIVGRGV